MEHSDDDSLAEESDHIPQLEQEGIAADTSRQRFQQEQEGTITIPDIGGDDVSDAPSRTALEKDMNKKRLPAERLKERNAVERDIHAARDVDERIKNFIQALPEKYTVLKQLGSGHSGSVFAAEERGPDGSKKNVAIKFLQATRGGFIDRRTREFSTHRVLPPHQNIVPLLSNEMQSTAGYEYFVMELCDTSLEHWIRKNAIRRRQLLRQDPEAEKIPAIGPLQTVQILYDLCTVLALLRELSITHRDIRPANILLKKEQEGKTAKTFPFQAKLADFGVADTQIVREAGPYTNYFGTWCGVKERAYTFDDDFRSVIATVFVAWLGDGLHDEHSRIAFSSEANFSKVFEQYTMTSSEEKLYDFFDHALPTQKVERCRKAYNLEKAVEVLTELGKTFSNGEWSPKHIKVVSIRTLKVNSELRDSKLVAYVRSSLSVISGRRYANDYGTAERYLRWAFTLLDLFDGDPPNDLLVEYYVQSALILGLAPFQQAVRRFLILLSDPDFSRSQDNPDVVVAQEGVEKTKFVLDEKVRAIRDHARKVDNTSNQNRANRAPGMMIRALATLEVVKYKKACGYAIEALHTAEQFIEELEEALSQQEEIVDSSSTGEINKAAAKRCYQICRNAYLILREAMMISQKSEEIPVSNMYKDLTVRAVTFCMKGEYYICIDSGSELSDKLEAGRCLSESFYIAGRHEEARKKCHELYDAFVAKSTQRTRLLRVIAVWVASLKFLVVDNKNMTFEYGYVCALLTSIHREAAKPLSNDSNAMMNARRFLAPSRRTAIEAGADDLIETPYLPNSDIVRKDASRALSALQEGGTQG